MGAGSAQQDKPYLPLRVIKVSDTCRCLGGVEFETPSQWSFHILSHTWTDQIRDLSSKVKEIDVGVLSYNDACRKADFRSIEGYEALRELLKLLEADGVKEIWIDALCINQASAHEKNREIPNMGAYYSQSKGCYVSTHGIGGGYKLLGSDSSLPKWFSRVWILQEFLLSKDLTFIVEGLDELTKWRWNRISQTKSTVGMCKCFNREDLQALRSVVWWGQVTARTALADPPDSRDKYLTSYFKNWGADLKMKTADVHRLVNDVRDREGARAQQILTKSRCDKCDSYPLLRKLEVCAAEVSESTDFYMVDREVYLTLAVVHRTGSLDPEDYWRADALKEQLEDSFLPYINGQAGGKLEPWFIVEQIRKRQCERNEDRVLAVLDLLGVGSDMVVEIGKTLDEQIVQLARGLKAKGDDRTLVNLCVVDGKGYGKPGMSWAPNFVEGRKLGSDGLPRVISEIKVEIVEVTAAGLRIVGGVCRAQFLLDDEDKHEHYFQISIPDCRDVYKIEISDCNRNSFEILDGGGIHLGCGPAVSHNGKLEFEAWLLLLGLVYPKFNMVLCCTSVTTHESTPQLLHLQKLGFFHTRVPTHLFLKQEVLIGGMGN